MNYKRNTNLLKPIPRKKLDSYTRFLAKWLLLVMGIPLAVGIILAPVSILILIVGLDFIWHKLEDMDYE